MEQDFLRMAWKFHRSKNFHLKISEKLKISQIKKRILVPRVMSDNSLSSCFLWNQIFPSTRIDQA